MEPITFITPIKPWESISGFSDGNTQLRENAGATMFKDVFANVVNEVYNTQADVENKQYLLATGQLDDAHTLPIAEAKAALSVEMLVSLRNKSMEVYNELLKMNI